MVEVDWAAVRADYEGSDLTVAQVAAKHGTKPYEIYKHKRDEGWRPRAKTKAPRTDILDRVYRILDRLTQRMEDAMESGKKAVSMSDLASVTRTLDKLIALRRVERRKSAPPESAALKTLRDKLADRLEQLNQG